MSAVRVASTRATTPVAAAAEIVSAFADLPPTIVLFFSGIHLDLGALGAHLEVAFPGAVVAGCTTSGEFSSEGATHGTVSALALGAPARAAATLIPLQRFQFESGAEILGELARRLDRDLASLTDGRVVLLTLTDGLSGAGEILAASLGAHAPGTPIIGGSAGDENQFVRTLVAVGGRTSAAGGVVILLEPGVPFRPFGCHHFHATERRVVVTSADPARRLIHELDGWPAARTLAGLLELPQSTLLADPLGVLARSAACFGFQHAGDWYMRSVMTVEGQSLLMGGAVEVGTVLRWMQPGDLVHETVTALEATLTALPGPAAGLLLFNCMGRMRTAEAHGLRDALSAALCRLPVAGFDTYGEHLGPFLVNETLTGIAFGEAPGEAPRG